MKLLEIETLERRNRLTGELIFGICSITIHNFDFIKPEHHVTTKPGDLMRKYLEDIQKEMDR